MHACVCVCVPGVLTQLHMPDGVQANTHAKLITFEPAVRVV